MAAAAMTGVDMSPVPAEAPGCAPPIHIWDVVSTIGVGAALAGVVCLTDTAEAGVVAVGTIRISVGAETKWRKQNGKQGFSERARDKLYIVQNRIISLHNNRLYSLCI